MENPDLSKTDCHSVWSQIKNQNQHLQLKRRWLLGLSESLRERKKAKRDNILGTRSLPESLIRDDDMFVDTVKSCVEETFGLHPPAATGHDVVSVHDSESAAVHDVERLVLSHMDDLSTKGLYVLAKTLVGSQAEFEKTRRKMKKVVRETLSVVGEGDNLPEIRGQIIRILNDPRNYLDSCVPFLSSSQIQRTAAIKVLEEVRSYPTQTLIAMHKKLNEELLQGMPRLQPKKCGLNRDFLIKSVLKNSADMLSGLGKEDPLPMPLVKAMTVANLSLKLTSGFRNSSTTEFCKLSPETETLQDDIIRAVWLVEKKVGLPVLEIIKNLLDSSAKVSRRSLRTVIRKVLTEYLFWCCDMDTVPKSLYKVVATINKNCQSNVPDVFSRRNSIDEEIECVLNVSAHTKQNLLDLLPADDLDLDFGDAYMEDLGDSDEELDSVDNNCDADDLMLQCENKDISETSSSNEAVESTVDSVPLCSKPCTSSPEGGLPIVVADGVEAKSLTGVETDEFSLGKKTTHNNQYLAIQEVCDDASMTAYSLIGSLLKAFGNKEGLDLDCMDKEDCLVAKQERASITESDGAIMVRVSQEVIPSVPRSGIERLRNLLGS